MDTQQLAQELNVSEKDLIGYAQLLAGSMQERFFKNNIPMTLDNVSKALPACINMWMEYNQKTDIDQVVKQVVDQICKK